MMPGPNSRCRIGRCISGPSFWRRGGERAPLRRRPPLAEPAPEHLSTEPPRRRCGPCRREAQSAAGKLDRRHPTSADRRPRPDSGSRRWCTRSNERPDFGRSRRRRCRSRRPPRVRFRPFGDDERGAVLRFGIAEIPPVRVSASVRMSSVISSHPEGRLFRIEPLADFGEPNRELLSVRHGVLFPDWYEKRCRNHAHRLSDSVSLSSWRFPLPVCAMLRVPGPGFRFSPAVLRICSSTTVSRHWTLRQVRTGRRSESTCNGTI